MIGVGLGIGLGDNLSWEELQLRAASGDAAAVLTLEMLAHMARCGQVEPLPALTSNLPAVEALTAQPPAESAARPCEEPRFQAPGKRLNPRRETK